MREKQVNPVEVPAWDAVELLRNQHTGRLCVIDHDTPIALPVSYRLDGTGTDVRIVMRCAPDGLLARYQGPASFEVDHIEQEQGRAWSVLARGPLRHAIGDPDLPDPTPWVAGDRHRWLVLDVRALSARRFSARPSDGGFAVDWTVAPTA